MAQIGVEARAELTSAGAATGSIWTVVPPVMIQHYTSPSLSVGAAQQARVDFAPTAGTFSVAVAFSATLSAGGENYVVPLGSVARAIYISNLGQVVNDNNWVRTS